MNDTTNQPVPDRSQQPEWPPEFTLVCQRILQFVKQCEGQRALASKIEMMLRQEFPTNPEKSDPGKFAFDFGSLGSPPAYLSDFHSFLIDHMHELVIIDSEDLDEWWALASSLHRGELEEALNAMNLAKGLPEGDEFLNVVHLENFSSCRSVDVTFTDKLAVLVGENAAGKTSILRGIALSSQSVSGRIGAVFSGRFGIGRMRSLGSHEATSLRLTGSKGTQFSLALRPGLLRPVFKIERTQSNAAAKQPNMQAFWPSGLFYFQTSKLAEPSPLREKPRLASDGAGLATLLAHFATNCPERLQAVIAGIRVLVPQVEDLRQQVRVEADFHAPQVKQPKYILEAKVAGNWVAADLLSEGTLLALGILALINQEKPPRLILIDDIDRGLHPQAQLELVRMLKQITEMEGGPQMIVSTHSSVFLDEIAPQNVLVVRNTPEGTKVKKLTDHPQWPEWEGSMTAGQFWPYVGEAWVEKA